MRTRRLHSAIPPLTLALSLVLCGIGTAGSSASASTLPSTETRAYEDPGTIAFMGDGGLTLVRADGRRMRPFLRAPGLDGYHPDWSPDGKTLAFEVDDSDGTDDIWLADRDGTHARRLFDCSAPCQLVQNPAWSPDGKQIAYAWNEFPPSLTQEIRVLDVRTGREVKAFTFPRLVGVIDPRWSPDGKRIAYTVQRFGGTGDDLHLVDGAVGLLNVNGSPTNGHAITPWRILGSYPAWSPSGDRIIFQAGDETPFDLSDPGSAGHTSDLWVVRPDGTGLRQLTHQGPNDPRVFGPDWGGGPHPVRVAIYAADGSSLVLGMLDADGSHLQPIVDPRTGNTIPGAHPRWVGNNG